MYCKCGEKIPEVRVKLGYTSCVKCSSEEKWGCSQVVYHKTGNTIEVIKDRELCEQINEMGRRSTFGVCNGMKGTIKKKISNHNYKKERPSKIKLSYEEVGQKTLELFDSNGIEEALNFLEESLKSNFISLYKYNKIKKILNEINHA